MIDAVCAVLRTLRQLGASAFPLISKDMRLVRDFPSSNSSAYRGSALISSESAPRRVSAPFRSAPESVVDSNDMLEPLLSLIQSLCSSTSKTAPKNSLAIYGILLEQMSTSRHHCEGVLAGYKRMAASLSVLTTESESRCGRSDGMFLAEGDIHNKLSACVSVPLLAECIPVLSWGGLAKGGSPPLPWFILFIKGGSLVPVLALSASGGIVELLG